MKHREHAIPCHVCGRPTKMLGTKKCDFCWNALGNISVLNADAVIEDACAKLGLQDTEAAKALLKLARTLAREHREHKP